MSARIQRRTEIPSWVRELRKSLGLTQERFAPLLGVSSASVARWEEGRARPLQPVSEKLERLAELMDLLSDVIAPEDTVLWLTTPRPDLRNYSPAAILDSQYGFEEVKDLVESIKQGAFS